MADIELMEALKEMYGAGGDPVLDTPLGECEDGQTGTPVPAGPQSVGERDVGMLTYIPLDQLYPHPDNPRKELGDLSELAESIKSKGVMQNLTVVPRAEGGYTVIIGHRRSEASRLAGLERVPCVIVEMSEREQVATMLLENMQRVDLTAFEQAQGMQLMMDLGETVESISEKTGFSKRTVRGRLKMAELDRDTFRRVSSERQLSIGDLEKIGQIEDIDARNKLLSECGTNNFEQSFSRALKQQKMDRAMPFVQKAIKEIHGNKIKYSETYGGKYQKILGLTIQDFKEGDVITIPENCAGKKLFYYIDESWGELKIYILTPKAAPVKRSAAEIEKEKRIKEAHEKLEALASEAYELRFNFVKGLRVTKANEAAMMHGAFMALICEQQYYNSNRNKNTVYETAGVEGIKDVCYVDPAFDKIVAAFEKDEKKMIPNIIYVSFADFRDEGFHTTWKYDPPKHRENKRLETLYAWLISLGYEMSDDERGMMDGTHPIFKEDL